MPPVLWKANLGDPISHLLIPPQRHVHQRHLTKSEKPDNSKQTGSRQTTQDAN
jgi:hypothetical protein